MKLRHFNVITLFIFTIFMFYNHLLIASENTTQAYKDKKTLSWLMALDEREVNAAKIALQKSHNENIKNYADEMINDHKKNSLELNTLLSQLDNTTIPLTNKAWIDTQKRETTQLTKLKSQHFDEFYLKLIINNQKTALQKLDKEINERNDSSTILGQLKATRDMISAHLDKAEAIKIN